MRALPPLSRPGQAPRTGVGELLGGGFNPVDEVQGLLPWQRNPAEDREGAKLDEPKKSDTKDFLQSNILVGPPRPWGALPEKGTFQKGDVPNGLRASLGLPHPFALPTEALREQEVATARLAARLAACERRMEAQEATGAVEDNETFRRVAMELRQLKDSMLTNYKLSDERFANLENAQERTRREENTLREHTAVLQNDFREFAGTAVSRQRSEIDSVVSRAFSQQNAANEEWRNAMRQRDAQLQSEVQRVSHAIEDVGHQLVSTQAELRTRLAALETSRLTGRTTGNSLDGAVTDVAGSHMVDFLKQQVDVLRQHVEQSAARIAELTARCDGDVAAQRAFKQENDTKITALGKAIAAERDNLTQRLLSRLEVLESRLGVERSEQAAKQAEIRDQVNAGDHHGSMKLQDVASAIRTEFEALERRMQSEMSALNGQVEAEFAQLRSARTSEEDVHQKHSSSLLHRLEGADERHAESIRSLRKEIDLSFKELRETISKECTVRAEEDRKLAAEATRSSHSIVNDLTTLQRFVQKQAELIAGELERMRWTNTDRADKLSRYVDEKVANGNMAPSPRYDTEAAALLERISTLKSSLEEQGRAAEQRIESFAEDFRVRLKKAEEAWMREASTVRRDAERTSIAVERRTLSAQSELKARFESYVKHFDAAISSVQTAILRPAPGDGADIAARSMPLSPTPPVAKSPVGIVPRRSPIAKKVTQDAPKDLGLWQQEELRHSHIAKKVTQDAPKDLGLWQQEELRCFVDGLRIHKEPDLASLVTGSLSRGDSVVVKNVIAPADGRRWACLTNGGFVLAFSEHGTPLLQLPSMSSQLAPAELHTSEATYDEDPMRHFEEQEQLRDKAAAKIQAARKGQIVRYNLLIEKIDKEQRATAATKLQAAERGRQVRKELRPLRFIREDASEYYGSEVVEGEGTLANITVEVIPPKAEVEVDDPADLIPAILASRLCFRGDSLLELPEQLPSPVGGSTLTSKVQEEVHEEVPETSKVQEEVPQNTPVTEGDDGSAMSQLQCVD